MRSSGTQNQNCQLYLKFLIISSECRFNCNKGIMLNNLLIYFSREIENIVELRIIVNICIHSEEIYKTLYPS